MAITRIWAVNAAWLFPAFGSSMRGYFRHLGLNLSVISCSHGSVAITRIRVLFAVKAAWLFLAFGSYFVCVKAAWLLSPFGSCLQCEMRTGYKISGVGGLGSVSVGCCQYVDKISTGVRLALPSMPRLYFAFRAAWLFLAFGSRLVCSQGSVAIFGVWILSGL